jgi:malate synthase
MAERIEKHGLQVDAELAAFIDGKALPDSGVTGEAFWAGLSALIHELGPKNAALLAKREELQSKHDAWHVARRGQPHDAAAYRAFLAEIGYLVPEGPDFTIETEATDPEFAAIPGPQLVVPVMNARYALNAANARWGSLYDALYGTDAMGDLPPAGGYDSARGARVIAWAKAHLDQALPLVGASWAEVTAMRVSDGAFVVETEAGVTGLTDPSNCWSIPITASAAPTRPDCPMSPSRPPSRRSWIAKIPSPASMERTRCWPIPTGWA